MKSLLKGSFTKAWWFTFGYIMGMYVFVEVNTPWQKYVLFFLFVYTTVVIVTWITDQIFGD